MTPHPLRAQVERVLEHHKHSFPFELVDDLCAILPVPPTREMVEHILYTMQRQTGQGKDETVKNVAVTMILALWSPTPPVWCNHVRYVPREHGQRGCWQWSNANVDADSIWMRSSWTWCPTCGAERPRPQP